MKLLLFFLSIASPVWGQCGKMAFNPQTGTQDCVGIGVPNYTANFTAVTTVTALGTAHKLATKALIAQCYDNATPAAQIPLTSLTINASTFDVTATWSGSKTGYCVINATGSNASTSASITSVTADGGISSSGGLNPNLSLTDTGVSAAQYGDATHIGQITIDAKGRATLAGNVLISIPASQVTSGTMTAARGGLGADASAFSGVLKISSGVATGSAALADLTDGARTLRDDQTYSNPTWLTALAYGKLTGTPTIPTVTGSAPLKGSSGNAVAAVSTDIAGVFTCSSPSTQYLRGDGTCATPPGTGGGGGGSGVTWNSVSVTWP